LDTMTDREKREAQGGQLPREMELASRPKLEGGVEICPEELRTLIELSPDLIAITGYDGHFQLLNMAWESALGYTRDELRAKPFIEFVHPEDREKTANMVERLLPGVPLFSFQNRYLCKDGTYRPIHWRGFSSVQAQRYYTVAREVSQVQAADDQRNVFEVICEQSRDAIVMAAANGVITEWTGAAERLFGYSRSEVVGQLIMRLLYGEDGLPVHLLDLPAPGPDTDRVRALFLHRDGQRVPVLVAAMPVGNADALVIGVIATISMA
jgi:PAS domain S-box-containing protein